MRSGGAASGTQPVGLVFGHPAGLFTLFFAEMWERFSYYGMRALLVFYMIKGFLAYGDKRAYAVYGAYTALVYATPFIGGMLADRLLGARRAVVLGGLLMAAGHLTMTVQSEPAFYAALALLICGNGFFKPNISSIVGSLYPAGSTRRDAGFTLFYMGINLGAAMSPVLCGYVGETYGWHYGFGLATVGMLLGVAVFVAPTWLTQVLVVGGALGAAVGMPFIGGDTAEQLGLRLLLGVALLIAGAVAFVALGRGGVPSGSGAPPDPAALARPLKIAGRSLGLRADWAVYLGALLSIPVFALLLQGSDSAMSGGLGIFGALAFGYLIYSSFISPKVVRERMWVVLVLTFFSLLFFAFFEQGGSSLNNFADRNVDRVRGGHTVEASEVGQTLAGLQLNQAQIGYESGGEVLNLTRLQQLRESGAATVDWTVTEAQVGMTVGGNEIPASEFQATNPVFILIFGLVLTGLWAWLGVRGLEPSTPVKFALGLVQLGLGFVVLWYAAKQPDSRGMVGMSWLLLAYLLHTTGELCLSPVGLSMVTKLAPAQLVSTVMGSWFLASAAANFVAGQIARLTGIEAEGAGPQVIPPPLETLGLYGDVFGQIGAIAVGSGLFCLALAPVLRRWMHEGEPAQVESGARRTPPATVQSERRARA